MVELANNLLGAIIDNHIYWGNSLEIDELIFNRCVDLNDRAYVMLTIKYNKKI